MPTIPHFFKYPYLCINYINYITYTILKFMLWLKQIPEYLNSSFCSISFARFLTFMPLLMLNVRSFAIIICHLFDIELYAFDFLDLCYLNYWLLLFHYNWSLLLLLWLPLLLTLVIIIIIIIIIIIFIIGKYPEQRNCRANKIMSWIYVRKDNGSRTLNCAAHRA